MSKVNLGIDLDKATAEPEPVATERAKDRPQLPPAHTVLQRPPAAVQLPIETLVRVLESFKELGLPPVGFPQTNARVHRRPGCGPHLRVKITPRLPDGQTLRWSR